MSDDPFNEDLLLETLIVAASLCGLSYFFVTLVCIWL
jgi:hypothetical protein